MPDPNLTHWLALDEDDNDPSRFLFALIEALQTLAPTCSQNPLSLLPLFSGSLGGSYQRGEGRRFSSVLINDILECLPEPFILVLDDLHFIYEPMIYQALDYLIERQPPQMHTAIATRHAPPLALPRLRARRQVAELRWSDLRFSLEDADSLINQSLALDLQPHQLEVLQMRTEGWPAGVSLLGTSLVRQEKPAERERLIDHMAHRLQIV